MCVCVFVCVRAKKIQNTFN